MNILLLAIATLLAGIMGFAIQRGATCTVAAMEEIVRAKRARRLSSMIEASLWVAGGFVIADALRLMPQIPGGFGVTPLTVMGGVLLGVGAFVNQACVFGAIARLGTGNWAYLATPVGFYLGCASVDWLTMIPPQVPLAEASPIFAAARLLALPIAAFMLIRIGVALWRIVKSSRVKSTAAPDSGSAQAQQLWSPHAATVVIGVTFFFLLLMMGAWAYTDVLADLASGTARNLPARMVLLLALIAGAVTGGWHAGRLRSTRVSLQKSTQCLAGGVLMGWGSLLIPGSNDGLILLGMPLLWPYAWVAFLAMCVSIGVIMLAQGRESATVA